MIDREGIKVFLVCDGCDQTFTNERMTRPYYNDEFDVMISDAKEQGWSIAKQDANWLHRCPDCK